jgi:hypothetical protein
MSRFKEPVEEDQGQSVGTWKIRVRQGDWELEVQGRNKEETIDLFERMVDNYGRSEKAPQKAPVPVA